MRRVTLITTGGTIEKTFDESTGVLENRGSVVRRMLRRLRLEETEVKVVELLSKDSLYMTDDDREAIIRAVKDAAADATGIVILHGTDTLDKTGDRLHGAGGVGGAGAWSIPVVLTGAMRPYEMKRSDALQNLTEAIFATGHLPPGVYCVAHGRVLRFPGVRKDRTRGTFVGGA